MSTQQIAKRLVELCRMDRYETAQLELYSDNAESIEPPNSPGAQSVKGLSAIIEKGKEFQNMIQEKHNGSISDPLVAGNSFAITFVLDVTMKGKSRTKLEEIGVYVINDGKL